MVESEDAAELLFFDTFSHEVDADINLDLVQFPKPVYITQVRIIPLGARVQADFPGGVRLGATNPSKFDIEFFVNDLGMPGASTFENLGQLQYNQNDCIHLECTAEKIPTDGLVLRGWYSTITLAVYGILTNSMNEPIASPPPPPCEPAGPEEICNLSAEGRSSALQEEVTPKDEWKEPLPGEAVAHVHKPSASDFEREDMEYAVTREHYHHSGDERERRLRKTSRSSERSVSSRNRTHSESNEREYLRARNEREREKSTRDWSRSPDYSRRSRRKRSERSRSDAEEPPKWPPRTPPASIDSPTRPRSPDNIEYADEDMHYKLKARGYMRSEESLTNAAPDAQTIEDDEAPGTPVEQYEPILSDDEIIGDDDSNATAEQVAADEFEMEVQSAAAGAEPAIVAFDAFTMPLMRYVDNLATCCHKELENLRLIFKKFDTQTKCASLAAFSESSTSVEERENFVYLSEQLINQLAYLSHQLKRRNFVLREFFEIDARHLEQAYNVLLIALEFEAACLQQQPAFKIRHIKVGARLTELLGVSVPFFEYLLNVQHFDPFAALFKLYQQDYMALSIKLMLLKAVYALLDTKIGIRQFITAKLNGYQVVLNALQRSHLTRNKFALQAIVRKLNLNEALECVREQCSKVYVLANYSSSTPADHYRLIEQALEQLQEALTRNSLSYQQPRRFLPVSKKFEIVPDAAAQRSFAHTLQSFLVQHAFAESLLLLLSNASELPTSLLLRCLDLMQSLLQTHVGVDYFVDDCFETTQMLISVLLGVDEVLEHQPATLTTDKHFEDAASTKKELPDKAEAKDSEQATTTASANAAPDAVATPPIILVKAERPEAVSAAVKSTEAPATSTTKLTIAVQNTQKPALDRLQQVGIELAHKVQTRYHLDAIVAATSSTSIDYDAVKLSVHLHALYSQTCSSPGRQHTVEVIGLNNNLQVFMDLIKKEQRMQAQRQLSQPGAKYKSPVLSYAVDMVDCCVRYCENLDYLIEHGVSILELAKIHETFEPSVSAVLQEMFVYLKPLEVLNVFAYDNIAPLVEVITRSLEYITTFPGDLIMGLRILRHLAIGPSCKAFKSADTEELKHRFVMLQFYAADGVQTLMQVLEKLCSYFEQPGLHAPALMTIQGVHCCQILLPALQILRTMLSYAIQCRDVEFRDLTAIDHLMKAYFLLHYFPAASQAANEIELAKREIIQTLLAYTQPNEQDEESLHKSLWTQMIREILKNIDGPYTFIPGLRVLAELLPLPLPMPLPTNSTQLPEVQTQRLIIERKLWSAHLHPQSAQIAKLIETIAPSTFPPLVDLMTRVCLQLADLAPNMTLLISKTLSDLVGAEWASASSMPSLQLARLLRFFARLTAFASLKISALSILCGKLWELFQSVLSIAESSEVVHRCQSAIQRVLSNFLDTDISLIAPQSAIAPELNLASALPAKDLIPRLAEAILVNLLNANVKHELVELALGNLVKLTQHDITFFHLTQQLKLKRSDFQQWLQKFVSSSEAGSVCSGSIEALILLLNLLTKIPEHRQQHNTIPARTLKMSIAELSSLLGFQKAVQPHLLERIRAVVERSTAPDKALLTHVNELSTYLDNLDGTPMDTDEDASAQVEPALPQSEGIVMQFVARPVFTDYDVLSDDSPLSARYWLQTACVEVSDAPHERIPCDLTALAGDYLPPETNLSSDCKRVLHLSASPQSNRERTPTAPCFRTRRVEVEPSTGRPEKKIYITPVRGRGFARAPPSRGDLFRSRPPNTSRPPSLHVDDFLALETCGAQPTGPTGYNKIPPLMRGSRVGRNRGSRISTAAAFRKTKALRTSSPSTWNDGGSPHYRTATSEPHFGDTHYSSSSHFSGRSRGRGSRARSYLR